VQPKLQINDPGDQYEKEADTVADKVMRMEAPFIPTKPLPINSVQRKCAECEEEEKKTQRKEINRSETNADHTLESYVANLDGSGHSLSDEVRNFYEPRFGYDFSNVKVHTDSAAARSARSINALAYTSGNNIVFNSGQYDPASTRGRQLLAHELTHLVQQHSTGSDGMVQRLIGDGHDLVSERFSGDEILEGCFDGEQNKYLRWGSKGEAVSKVQQTLVDLGYELPVHGVDSIFGNETGSAVSRFKSDNDISPSDPVVGPKTIGKMDQLVADNENKNKIQSNCKETAISQEKEPLPDIPMPSITRMSAPELLELVKKRQTPGAFIPPNPPLGACQPTIGNVTSAKAKALPIAGTDCFRCTAEWDMVKPTVEIFIATGSFSDEPQRFFVARQGDVSGCPQGVSKKEVMKMILPEAEPKILDAELEHWADFVMSYMLVGGRYLSNIRRLTPERTHLRGKTEDECTQKVAQFLMDTSIGLPVNPLGAYGPMLASDLTDLFILNTGKRDESAHSAISKPPREKAPVFPNIDTDKNPFGCKAYFRKFDKDSGPGIPGPTFIEIMEDPDGNIPQAQTWHTL
jgi:peptidoglycan hydrolase-like protein with peptidoglycan-binding domain